VLGAEWVDPGEDPACVILTPKQLKARDLARAMSLVDALGWPILGVLSYGRSRRRIRRPGRAAPEAVPEPPDTLETQALDSYLARFDAVGPNAADAVDVAGPDAAKAGSAEADGARSHSAMADPGQDLDDDYWNPSPRKSEPARTDPPKSRRRKGHPAKADPAQADAETADPESTDPAKADTATADAVRSDLRGAHTSESPTSDAAESSHRLGQEQEVLHR
jgi:hypothetical protein